jgi:AsmA protein
LLARATIEASGVTAEPSYSGQLETEPFNARELLAAMALPVSVTGDTNALTRVQLTTKFDGTAQKVSVKPLTLKLDDSVLSGELAIVDIAKQALRFAVQLDKLDADRYLPPEAEDGAIATASAKPAAEVAAELLPVETLRGLDLKGSFKADQVTVKHIALQDITLSIKAVDGDVRIEDIAAKLLQGTLAGSVIVDASKAQPHITSKLALTDIEMSQLLQPFMNVQLLSGRSSLKLDTSTTGNDMDTLIKQALGHIDLAMADTVLHGVNVNQIALEAIKSKLGDVALLLPDYQQKLPKALKTDTEIRKLLANITVEKGHLIMPAFNADTGQGAFSASGDIDLLNQGFDYRFAVVLAALSDNKYLQGKQWPVRCKGNLATAVTEWCRPDSSAISKVLEQAASQALRDKGAQKLGEKLGLEAADQEAVEAELRNKAKAKEDRAKEKLKQSVNKKLNKLLEKQE